MAVRVEDGGESKRRAVMARIRVATCPTRKRADFLLVFRHERTWPIGLTGSADDGASWCSPEPKSGMGSRRLAKHRSEVRRLQARIVKAVQQKQMEQGESLATSAHALGERQITRRSPGDRERRQENTRRGRGTLGYTSEETSGATSLTARGYHPQPSAANLHSEGKWQTATARDSDDAGSEPCRRFICWLSIRLRKPWRIANPMVSGRARSCADAIEQCFRRSGMRESLPGYSKATSKAASTTSVISGCSTMFHGQGDPPQMAKVGLP